MPKNRELLESAIKGFKDSLDSLSLRLSHLHSVVQRMEEPDDLILRQNEVLKAKIEELEKGKGDPMVEQYIVDDGSDISH